MTRLPGAAGPSDATLLDLERRFIASDARETRSAWEAPSTLGWKDLRLRTTVVVLGEAGTGKTSEFRREAAAMRGSGMAAFFLPVESIGKYGVENTVNVHDIARFRAWRDSEEKAWFFLDSVDESTLHGTPLTDPVHRLTRDLQPQLSRIHVLLSCRVSDWRKVEEAAVLELNQTLDPTRKPEAVPIVVTIAPLDHEQVSALVRGYGLEDPRPLLEAVDQANAWGFVERPLDVEWLTRHWVKHGRLGTHRELVENCVHERLSERADRDTTLSPEQVRRGASRLALVSVLSGRPGIQVPGMAGESSTEALVDPQAVLGDWTAEQLRDLLARGLFDQATYGRVRVHHRAVLEFLAAEQVLHLLKSGLSREALHAIFFRPCGSRVLIPRPLAAAAAWVALEDASFRTELIRRCPEQLIDEGDPSSLSKEANSQIVRAYAQRYANCEWALHRFDSAGLRRFAASADVATIGELLTTETASEHVRRVLLDVVEEGQLANVVPFALDIALADDTTETLRVRAIDAVVAAGSREQKERLGSLLAHPCLLHDEIASALLRAECSVGISGHRLVAVLAGTEPGSRSYHLLDTAKEAARSLDEHNRAAALQGLLSLIVDPLPGPNGAPKLVPTRVWLVDVVTVLVRDVVRLREAPPALSLAFAVLRVVPVHDHGMHLLETEDVLRTDAVVREAMFWRQVEEDAARTGKFPRAPWMVDFAVDENDADWLSAACKERTQARERLLAFNALVSLSVTEGERMAHRARILETIRAGDDFHRDGALQKHWERANNRPMVATTQRWALRQKVWELQTNRRHDETCHALRSNLESIRQGKDFKALMYLQERCRPERGHADRHAVSVEVMRRKYGADIAAAGEAGFKRFWRDAEAQTRAEFGEERRFPWSAIMALAGIELEVAAGLVPADLPTPLLRKAITFAMWETGQSPAWFRVCALRHPELVRDVFAGTVEHDFNEDTSDPERLGHLLYCLPQADESVRRACAPVLERLLQSKDPARTDRLRSTLEVLESTGSHLFADPTQLIQPRVQASTADYPRLALWWCMWVCRDPVAAIEVIEQVLAVCPDGDSLMLEVCGRMHALNARQAPSRLGALPSNAQALGRLYTIVRRHVREAQDIDRTTGVVYSPSLRDDAQDIRNRLLNWLANIPGTDTVDALDAAAAQPGLSGATKGWIQDLAEQRSLSDLPSMTPIDAVRVMDELVFQPTTSAELFTVVLNRLADIAHDVANGDFSFRQVFSPKDEPVLEEPVQNYLARELESRSKAQYDVSREDEVTRRKKPDIRLRNPRCEGPATLEVKVAERWTISQLEDAITTQLVGQYMADKKSRHGALVLCTSGPSKTWHLATPSGTRVLNFRQLQEHLKQFAQDLAARTPTVAALSVVAVDFHEPA